MKSNGAASVGFDEIERSKSVPPIATIVDDAQTETSMAGRSSSPPTITFWSKVGPNTFLTLAGAIIGAAVGWGIAGSTISHLEHDLARAQTDIKVLQRADADAGAERAAVRQWMLDHGVKLATPSVPPTQNQGDQ